MPYGSVVFAAQMVSIITKHNREYTLSYINFLRFSSSVHFTGIKFCACYIYSPILIFMVVCS